MSLIYSFIAVRRVISNSKVNQFHNLLNRSIYSYIHIAGSIIRSNSKVEMIFSLKIYI